MSLHAVLAKDCLDIGVFTDTLAPMLEFWQQEVGLAFDHMLSVGGGIRQHRHDHQGSVFKLNHSRDPLPRTSSDSTVNNGSGYLRILVARPALAASKALTDPDGNRVLLVPAGDNGVTQWAIEVATGSAEEFYAFYEDGLGLTRVPTDDYSCAVACGRSLILGCVQPNLLAQSLHDSQRHNQEMRRVGITYTTIQVQKVDSVFDAVVRQGGLSGREPATLGKTARIAFVRDRRGNWVELSQRASLTGSLDVG